MLKAGVSNLVKPVVVKTFFYSRILYVVVQNETHS